MGAIHSRNGRQGASLALILKRKRSNVPCMTALKRMPLGTVVRTVLAWLLLACMFLERERFPPLILSKIRRTHLYKRSA